VSVPQIQRLTEATYAAPTNVDRAAGVISGVKVLGRDSKNGRTYSDQAMADNARLAEGAKVHINHPERDRPNRERGISEMFGELKNITTTKDGNFAELHYVKSHPMAESIVERAERFPRSFGLSQNAEGKVRMSAGKQIVESLVTLRSVDLVDTPATTAGLYESAEGETKSLLEFVQAIEAATDHRAELLALLEMDAAMAKVPTGMSGQGMDAKQQMKAAFRSLIVSILDDESLDTKAALGKIKEILQSQEKVMSDTTAKKPEDTAKPDEGKPEETMESLKAKIASMEAEATCRTLLEQAGQKCEPAKLKALVALTEEADRAALIETWKATHAAATKPATSAPLRESIGEFPKSNEEFVRLLKR
jgi:hypothetical protein